METGPRFPGGSSQVFFDWWLLIALFKYLLHFLWFILLQILTPLQLTLLPHDSIKLNTWNMIVHTVYCAIPLNTGIYDQWEFMKPF